jgi:hypothetical protein
VKKVLRGPRRAETDRFIALRSHYLFESIFTRPGIEGAHENQGSAGGQASHGAESPGPALHPPLSDPDASARALLSADLGGVSLEFGVAIEGD